MTILKSTCFLIVFSGILFLNCLNANAQVNYNQFINSDPASLYAPPPQKPVVASPFIMERDVKFSRRVIRCIDTRQKMNKQLEWPRDPLNRLLYNYLAEGSVRAFKNDSLSSTYTNTQFKQRGSEVVSIWVQTDSTDPSQGYDSETIIHYDITKSHKFWVMEDWIFDSKHSVFKPVIIAIAPVFAPEYAGIETREQPLCWIKMDEIRQLLTNHVMFNRYNQAANLTYDDFFVMRMFDSHIIYESNVFDNHINQFDEYADNGVAALLKSDEIKNDLFIFEHDLWQF